MNVLVTGAYGRCGTALIDHLVGANKYDFTFFNRSDRPDHHPYGGYDTIVGDVTDGEILAQVANEMDTIVHMAAFPNPDGNWDDVFAPNIVGTYHMLEAARKNEIERVVFLSSNHVMGKYESVHSPELYERGYGLVLDHTDPVRPDSYYGVSKSFGEDLGRFYVEEFAYPKTFYALRTGTVNWHKYDHPYGDAEEGVEKGEFDRGDHEYAITVKRMKCTWQSRRDFAHQIACCLDTNEPGFDVFYGVSDNRRRWFDLEHARARIGYHPQDDAEEWEEPPTEGG